MKKEGWPPRREDRDTGPLRASTSVSASSDFGFLLTQDDSVNFAMFHLNSTQTGEKILSRWVICALQNMGSPLSTLSTNFYLIPKRYDTTFEGLFLATLSALETLAVLRLRSSTEKGQCPKISGWGCHGCLHPGSFSGEHQCRSLPSARQRGSWLLCFDGLLLKFFLLVDMEQLKWKHIPRLTQQTYLIYHWRAACQPPKFIPTLRRLSGASVWRKELFWNERCCSPLSLGASSQTPWEVSGGRFGSSPRWVLTRASQSVNRETGLTLAELWRRKFCFESTDLNFHSSREW